MAKLMPPKRSPSPSPAPGRKSKGSKAWELPPLPRAPKRIVAAESSQAVSEEAVASVFRRFDYNGSGSIEKEELGCVLKALTPGRWTDIAIGRLFDAMDLDDDGAISTAEFLEWVFEDQGGSTQCFKGAIELAETKAGASTIAWSAEHGERKSRPSDVIRDLERIRGANLCEEVQALEPRDLEALSLMPVVPEPVRRLLEAVCLILAPSAGSAFHAITCMTPPEWPDIQKTLVDTSFLQRILNFDARKADLRKRPMWGSYVVKVYFAPPEDDTEPEPLAFDQVQTASQSLFGLTDGKNGSLIVLFRWCLALLEPDLHKLGEESRLAAGVPGSSKQRVDEARYESS